MIASYRHQFVKGIKRLIYGRRGEPYRIEGHELRFLPGTRPVRMRYVNSKNPVVRYDALQIQLLSKELRPGDTAVDIGAHWGSYSLLMAAKCGKTGQVVAFEPDPHAREILKQNLDLNSWVKRPVIETAACSDTAGEAILYSRGGNAQSSLAQSGIGFLATNIPEEIHVPLVTLDGYLEEHELPEPRWVKIDAEGAEIRILKGARNVLAGSASIICELHPYAWPEFGNSLAELKELAATAGRRLRYLDRHTEIGADATYGTVLIEKIV